MSTFMAGDTVSKVDSNLADKVQDGDIGVVVGANDTYVSVLFTGQPHELLVLPEKLYLMHRYQPAPQPISDADEIARLTRELEAMRKENERLTAIVNHDMAYLEEHAEMCGYLSDICEAIGMHDLTGAQIVEAVRGLAMSHDIWMKKAQS